MRISQLLQSELVKENTVIEIYRKMKTMDKWERVACGYFYEYPIIKFEDAEVIELSWKSYPNVLTLFI